MPVASEHDPTFGSLHGALGATMIVFSSISIYLSSYLSLPMCVCVCVCVCV